MDVLKRISELQGQRNWSEYMLAEQSGITQSTISSWYRDHRTPSLRNIKKICDTFDITLSQFFMEEDELNYPLNQTQYLLVKATEKLTKEQIIQLTDLIKSL